MIKTSKAILRVLIKMAGEDEIVAEYMDLAKLRKKLKDSSGDFVNI